MTFRASYFTVQPQPLRPQDIQSRNLVLLSAAQPLVFPVGETLDETVPAPKGRQLDFQFPNIALTPATFVFRAPLLSWPAPKIRQLDFQFPNTALAPTTFVFRAPLLARPAPAAHPIDVQLPNLAVLPPPVGRPLFAPIYERPPPAWKAQDFQAPNIVITIRPFTVPDFLFGKRPAGPLPVDFLFLNLALQAIPVPIGETLDESIPAPKARQSDFQFPNVALLNFAQLQVPSVGEILDETVPRVPSRSLDFQFPNIALLNFAQLQVKPVGAALDETVPVAWRPREFFASNLLLIQPAAVAPFSVPIFDRPVPAIRAQDTQFPNITLLNFAQSQVKPVGAALDETVPLLWRPREFFAPNLLPIQPAAAAPFVNPIFDRPQLVARQQDFLAPNLLTLQPAVAAAPFVSPAFDRPRSIPLQQDFLVPNLLTTTLSVTFFPATAVWAPWPQLLPKPLEVLPYNFVLTAPPVVKPPFIAVFERPLPAWKAQDFQAPNIVVMAPAVAKPGIPPLFSDRPLPQQHPQDFAFLNIALAPPAIAPPFAPIFERPVAVAHPVDAPLPNLLTTTLAVVVSPSTAIWEPEPRPLPRRQDILFPNLLITPLAVVVKPPFNLTGGERPAPQQRVQEFVPPNQTLRLPVAPNPSTIQPAFLLGFRPPPPPPPIDTQFPNLPLILTPPAPAVSVLPHQNPVFVTVGRLMTLQGDIGGGVAPPPGAFYVAEDGLTFYVAEDGTTFYVPE